MEKDKRKVRLKDLRDREICRRLVLGQAASAIAREMAITAAHVYSVVYRSPHVLEELSRERDRLVLEAVALDDLLALGIDMHAWVSRRPGAGPPKKKHSPRAKPAQKIDTKESPPEE